MADRIRIRTARPLDGFTVELGLTNGATKIVDLERYLRGPIFAPIRNDQALFNDVQVDPRAGTIVWPNGADIDPDVLCYDLEPAGP